MHARPTWVGIRDGRAHKASIDCDALHITALLPFIGKRPLRQIHDATLEPFKVQRRRDGVSETTIKRALEVVRCILNLAGTRAATITSHYSAPELAELIRAANAVLKTQESTLLRVVIGQLQAVNGGKSRKSRAERKTGQELCS